MVTTDVMKHIHIHDPLSVREMTLNNVPPIEHVAAAPVPEPPLIVIVGGT